MTEPENKIADNTNKLKIIRIEKVKLKKTGKKMLAVIMGIRTKEGICPDKAKSKNPTIIITFA